MVEGKKFALISWKKKMPTLEGGLHIRDLKIQNMAFGAKVLWKLVDSNLSWSSHVIKHKYLSGSRLWCIDNEPENQQGTPIFSLCRKALPRFNEELHWMPGNGKLINIWKDTILGKPPPYLPRIKN